WLREHGIRAELDLRQRAVRAEVSYANRRSVPFLLLVEQVAAKMGSDFRRNDGTETVTLRRLADGTEQALTLREVVQVVNG
ncbi:MAG: hypothetical protein F4X83_01980, partial [Chloroflexi bacterium]|nr:hypothetical protein [Chloroflexota bacterium]